VIHRDLKGANVLITPQGCAKVLDFGLARRDASVVTTTMSVTPAHPGTMAGTPAFMAPELLRGGKADARSDIWALGVLLYEMASGRRPYVGETPFEVTSAVLRDTPPPLPSRVPAALRSIIVRCLARDPGDRFQHASDVGSALRTGRSATPLALAAARTGRRRAFISVAIAAALSVLAYVGYRAYSASQGAETTSIAVMPFNMPSGPPELAFLEIGVPDTIMSRLALVNGLRVHPVRTALKATENLKDLHVDYVLTGSIQKWGDAIRITPQLVRVSDAAAIWTHAYTLPSTDLLAMQDEIARGVANALPVRMTAEDRARVSRQLTQDAEAYALYVRGRTELVRNDRSDASTVAAVNSFQAAIGRDQNYVLAYAGLAMASAKMRLFFATEPEVAMWQTRARQAAQRAVQLNSDLAETHEALAAVYRSADFDWPATLEESARALKLNPSLDQPHAYRASAFSHLSLLDRVQAEANAARENNPANESEPLRVQGATAMYAGRFDDAVRLLEAARAASGSPTDWNLAYAHYYAGHRTESESMLQKMTGSARSHRRAQATLASFLAARGEVAKARELIGIVTSASYQEHHIAYALGAAYAQLGMPDEALQRLTEARATGFRCYPWFERDPLLAPLKDNPKFRAFLEDFRQWWQTTKAAYETNG
jgi:TolB-like protein